MNRIFLGALCALVLAGIGMFRWQYRGGAGRTVAARTYAFRKLDKEDNNSLSFEEWAVATAERFDKANRNINRELTPEEFATTAPKTQAKATCRC